jgi:hypothetical protein
MDDKEARWRAVEKAKARKAERLFNLFFPEASHWKDPSILLPFNPTNYPLQFKQGALSILSTGIIGENGLKGYAGNKEFFPINQRDLIIALLDTDYQYRDVVLYPEHIIKHFDNCFATMAAMARMADVTDNKIEKEKERLNKWREAISLTITQGGFPSNWREILKKESITAWNYKPRSRAHAFANVFLEFASKASDKTIGIWTNTSLKSLGHLTASLSKLRGYISQQRNQKSWLRQEPSQNSL